MTASSTHAFLPAMGHDRLLPLYDAVQRLLGVPALHRLLVESADLSADLDDGPRTLEVGCGTGNLMILAERLGPGAELVGIDPDPRALDRARRKAGPAARLRFDEGYAQDLPHPDASFDRVLSAFMFHHLDAQVKRRTLEEIRRVLRPGGSLHLVDFGGRVTRSDGLWARVQLRSPRLRDNLGNGIPTLLREAGLTDVTERAHHAGRVGPVTFYQAVEPG